MVHTFWNFKKINGKENEMYFFSWTLINVRKFVVNYHIVKQLNEKCSSMKLNLWSSGSGKAQVAELHR